MTRKRKQHPAGRGDARHRVGEELRMKLSELLLREVRDPRVQGVHFTRVEMSRDLGRADVYFRTLPGMSSPESASRGLEKAAGFLRREVGRSLRLRGVPELHFSHDELPDEGDRIEALLRQAGSGDTPEPEEAPEPTDDAG